MRKIPTLFLRDSSRKFVTSEISPGCEWVLAGEGLATRKYDGTCTMFDGERWWSRREVKEGKEVPVGFMSMEYDETTHKTVGWEPAEGSSFIKYLDEARAGEVFTSGTYELYGPKINGNPENYTTHVLVKHGVWLVAAPRDFNGLREWMAVTPYEGIVWWHPDGRMAKLKRRDFPRLEGP